MFYCIYTIINERISVPFLMMMMMMMITALLATADVVDVTVANDAADRVDLVQRSPKHRRPLRRHGLHCY